MVGREKYYATKEWHELSDKVKARDGNVCRYCGKPDGLVAHHLIPRKRGGKDAEENLITLCRICHRTDHGHISHHGFATIPGPEWEMYRFELTQHEDVMRYADYLDSIGISGDWLREQETLRGM